MASLTFAFTDTVGVSITVTEQYNGTLLFALDVDDSAGTAADLNAWYFDLADDSLASGLTVSGADVTDDNFEANKVTKIDAFTNMNGEVVKEYGKFDGGVQFGHPASPPSTSFVPGHDTVALTLNDILAQDFGISLPSVGELDGARQDSMKLGGTAPDIPDQPPEPERVNTANSDILEDFADKTFSTDGTTDILFDGSSTVITNDTSFDGTDEFIYTGDVSAANNDPGAVAQVVMGDNGGELIMCANGTVDFSANGDFDDQTVSQEELTSCSYAIEGGVRPRLTSTFLVWAMTGGAASSSLATPPGAPLLGRTTPSGRRHQSSNSSV
ncbi:hypothetical protein [Yoonia sediminilitoris]|uniref:Uncharacterized protein n=1 Tax=Yoonia sediminilitoris TaxID=1286148 RepID=A0A2T6KRR4_9RHOB|nr:hypothetical protein [Yoonia sediminilitoris]PUB19215.1 hypothetical protein C8N45_101808 [Yoonia sediminilitoris]RCW99383.1 hypothetical protein DFP92_101808 [Yoonia sediminilitoris]